MSCTLPWTWLSFCNHITNEKNKGEMMKKLFLMILAGLILAPAMRADAKSLQLGADIVVPYRTDSPSGRLGTLGGAHGELFLSDSAAVNLTTLFGIEDTAGNEPVYFIPGLSLYLPSPIFKPFLQASVPVLLNNGQDVGIQGGGGLLWNIIAGLGLKYQVDVAYYFDTEATIINWVHASAVFTF
jgi:hypothetical protein